jgi:hypothetical protein
VTRRAYPAVHYEQVAEVVREAAAAHYPEGKAVAEAWDVPLSTAHAWTMRARRRGLLPPGRLPRPCSSRCAVHCPRAET